MDALFQFSHIMYSLVPRQRRRQTKWEWVQLQASSVIHTIVSSSVAVIM